MLGNICAFMYSLGQTRTHLMLWRPGTEKLGRREEGMKEGKIEIWRRRISIQSGIVLYNFKKKKVKLCRTDVPIYS